MELKKWPNTEEEYWKSIEALGGFLWSINHDLGDGRMESSSKLEAELISAWEIQETLLSELFVNFGVVHPKNCPGRSCDGTMPDPPPGVKWYWTWYKEMKRRLYDIDYNKLICSACPLSEGLDRMITLGGIIPCSVYPGMINRLLPPYECAMVNDKLKGYTQEKLLHEIRKRKGEEGVSYFLQKQNELMRVHLDLQR